MRRTSLPIVILAALLLVPATASAKRAGHNPPTKKIEGAFSIALTERVESDNGCYPSEKRLAKVIGKRQKSKAGVIKKVGQARRAKPNRVYVVKQGTSCNGVRLALLFRNDLYVLDSIRGDVLVVGNGAAGARRKAAIRANRGPLRALRLVNKTTRLSKAGRRIRFEARCPGKTVPLGGGFFAPPGPGPDGEGVYPHSFERLGAQRGFHVTAWLYAPSGNASRNVTTQVLCGKGLAPMTSPHKTTFVQPGQTRTAVARCPGGQKLMSGGFQRTNMLDGGGNYITESKAISPRAWSVTASAFGFFGGELTALAYCVKSKKRQLTEVSATSPPFALGESTSVTTPPCRGRGRMAISGFSANGSQQTWFGGATVNGKKSLTAHSFGRFGAAPGGLTAYGYCLKPGS